MLYIEEEDWDYISIDRSSGAQVISVMWQEESEPQRFGMGQEYISWTTAAPRTKDFAIISPVVCVFQLFGSHDRM